MDKEIDKSRNKFLEMFITFFKIGICTFGGGYAMIPLIEREIVDNKKWLKKEEILEVVAIAESTPGPIAVNAATFVGYRVCGVFGAFMATLGVVLPSFLIISILSFVIESVENMKLVKYAFWGIRAGVLALIVKAFIYMYSQSKKNILSYFIMSFAFFAVTVFNVNAIIVILISAIIGVIATYICGKEVKQK